MSFYNGFRDDLKTWDDDRLLGAIADMQLAMRLLKTRE